MSAYYEIDLEDEEALPVLTIDEINADVSATINM
jgi:hypothetical protein